MPSCSIAGTMIYSASRVCPGMPLDLMVKKDLDISLMNPELTLDGFFKLSLYVSKMLQPIPSITGTRRSGQLAAGRLVLGNCL